MNHPNELGRCMTVDAERQAQIEEARRLAAQETPPARRTITLTLNDGAKRPQKDQAPIKRPGGKPVVGHEAFLRALCHSGANVIIEKVSSGQQYQGKLKHSDSYTVTMLVASIKQPNDDEFVTVTPVERVIYKHDISEFYTTTARVA